MKPCRPSRLDPSSDLAPGRIPRGACRVSRPCYDADSEDRVVTVRAPPFLKPREPESKQERPQDAQLPQKNAGPPIRARRTRRHRSEILTQGRPRPVDPQFIGIPRADDPPTAAAARTGRRVDTDDHGGVPTVPGVTGRGRRGQKHREQERRQQGDEGGTTLRLANHDMTSSRRGSPRSSLSNPYPGHSLLSTRQPCQPSHRSLRFGVEAHFDLTEPWTRTMCIVYLHISAVTVTMGAPLPSRGKALSLDELPCYARSTAKISGETGEHQGASDRADSTARGGSVS
jgi:hypothetical protein